MSSIFKYLKPIVFIVLVTVLLLFTSSGCNILSYKGVSEGKTEKGESIYFSYPLRDYPIGKTEGSQLYWDSSENDFGNYLGEYNGLVYDGFHPGEDWNLKGEKDGEIDNGLPVYSIGIGKVIKISDLGSLGYLVVIEHDGNFVIPAKEINSNGQKATYKEEVVDRIYSVYLHLKNIKVNENDNIDENTIIGYIMDPGGSSHLHFEIRKNNDNNDSSWSLVGDKSNWQKFLGGGYNGYYKDLQKMIDAGLRDASDFIEANYKSDEEYKSQEEIVEEKTYKTTTEGKIVFMSYRDGNGEIYIMNIDGSEQKRLTDNPAEDKTPCFSPDGSKIAFVSNRDGNSEIYIMNVDGSEQVNLTNNTADDGGPCFSPDGSKIAFVSNRDGNSEIYVMNVDGSGQVNLTNSPEDDWNPCFSPDGSKIAFQSKRDGNFEIYIINVDGSDQVNLTNNPADDWWPCFSPNGSKIAFHSDRDGNFEIYTMNIDGSGQRRLTDNPEYDWYPSFSPDGSKIAFTSYRDGNFEIYIINVDGSDQVNLTNNPADDSDPCFSPDGSKIAFGSFRDGNREIYIMNVDGSGQINLTDNPADEYNPSFSP